MASNVIDHDSSLQSIAAIGADGIESSLVPEVAVGASLMSQRARVVPPLALDTAATRGAASQPTHGGSVSAVDPSRQASQAALLQGSNAASLCSIHEPLHSGGNLQSCPGNSAHLDSGSYTVVVRHTEQVFGSVSNLWETKHHSDVTLVAGCTQIAAHKVILASQSDYFDRLLFGSMMEAQQDTINIEGVGNVDAFLLLLKYAYSGVLDIHDGNLQVILEVLALSDRFGFVLLKTSIGSYLSTKLSATNATELLVYSDLYSIEELHDKCLAYFDKNAIDFLRSDGLLSLPELSLKSVVSRDSFYVPEVSIFQAVVGWMEHNGLVAGEGLPEVLKCIRLSEMSPQDIFEVVEPRQLFSEPQLLSAVRAQVKQEFQHMKPRGKKVASKNLFEQEAKLDQSLQYSGISTSAPPTSITTGTVHLGAKHTTHVSPTTFASGSRKHVVVTLEDVFLINVIEVEGIPTPRNAVATLNNSFSYELMISKDKKNWAKLVDYSRYCCYGVQKLIFPTVAFKYLRFQLTSENSYSIRFVCCEFREACCPTQLRHGGVIAPLSPAFSPLVLQSEYRRTNCSAVVLVAFNQPYSIAQLRFRVSGPPCSDAEVSVSVSSVYQEKAFKNVATARNSIPSSLLTVDLKEEQVVCYVMLTLKNLPPAAVPLDNMSPSKLTPEQNVGGYFVTDLSCQAFSQTL